jgi:hypothetical protein
MRGLMFDPNNTGRPGPRGFNVGACPTLMRNNGIVRGLIEKRRGFGNRSASQTCDGIRPLGRPQSFKQC